MKLITCSHRPSTSCLSLKFAYTNSPSLNRLTQRLTVLTTTHFTLSIVLLYLHQHTSPYPASYCTHINTLHLTHRLTVLTSTHFTLPTVLLYSHQHTSPYPPSYCTHINTLITINGLHSSVNFNWRNFSTVQNSIAARCLNRSSENSSISMCTG